LDALAAKLQTQSRSARTATANHAQRLVNKFVKLENKNFKPIVALARTVTGDPVFSSLFQLEAGVHQDLLTVKTQVLPQFRLLIGATFSENTPQSEQSVSGVHDSHAPGQSNALDARGPERDDENPSEADAVIVSLVPFLVAMDLALYFIADPPEANLSCSFVESHSLGLYNNLLNVMRLIYNTLEPILTSDVAQQFVNAFNATVAIYNTAVMETNEILDSGSIETHP
jgi:hypothetical protein